MFLCLDTPIDLYFINTISELLTSLNLLHFCASKNAALLALLSKTLEI